MRIFEVTDNKKQYIDLLFLADEQEDMIDRYLEKGTMFALEDGGKVLGVCVVLPINGGKDLEIKNLATDESVHGKGYGKKLVHYVRDFFWGQYDELYVGTGDSPMTVPFYEKCGFVRSHLLENFFIDNYDHPIFECGIQLVHMVYLKMPLR